MPFSIAPHIRAAHVHGDLIFVDLDDDSYLCLTGCDARTVVRTLEGREHDPDDPVVTELVDAGLLRAADEHLSAFLDRSLAEDGMPPRGRTLASLRLIPSLLMGLAHYLLRRKTLLRRPPRVATGRALDEEGIACLVQDFRQLRLFLPRSGRCFIQSWLLLRLLRRRGVAAQWIFGVRTYPFEAHCWIEWQGRVLNDWAEHVHWYSPIAEF